MKLVLGMIAIFLVFGATRDRLGRASILALLAAIVGVLILTRATL
jgi:hypothetical protein